MRSSVRLGLILAIVFAAQTLAQGAFAGSPRDAASVFEKATAAGDIETIAALYAPDAVLLAPGGQTIAGRDAIRTVHRSNQATGPNTIRFTNVKVEAGDDRAVVLWTWTLEIKPQGRPLVVTKGRSLVYWKQTSGTWQIAADMFQTLPP